MTTWNPIAAEAVTEASSSDSTEIAAELAVPELTIFNLPDGEWGEIPQIKEVNCYPTHMASRHDPRTRQVAKVLVTNRDTGMVPIVQPAKAGSDEWSLIQGGIERNETALEAVHREAREEAGIELTDVIYAGSYRAPVADDSDKKEDFDHQLFHCFVACTNDVEATPRCDGIAYAAMFHQYDVLPILWRTASAVKKELLPPIFRAAVAHELLPPRACQRD